MFSIVPHALVGGVTGQIFLPISMPHDIRFVYGASKGVAISIILNRTSNTSYGKTEVVAIRVVLLLASEYAIDKGIKKHWKFEIPIASRVIVNSVLIYFQYNDFRSMFQ